MHALNYIVNKIEREGRRQYANEGQLLLLNDTFQKAIDKSKEVLREIKEGLQAIYECDVELDKLVDEKIVQEFEYREFNNWIIFREYANQLEFNIAAFKILMGRIQELRADTTNTDVSPWQVSYSRRRRQKEQVPKRKVPYNVFVRPPRKHLVRFIVWFASKK